MRAKVEKLWAQEKQRDFFFMLIFSCFGGLLVVKVGPVSYSLLIILK